MFFHVKPVMQRNGRKLAVLYSLDMIGSAISSDFNDMDNMKRAFVFFATK